VIDGGAVVAEVAAAVGLAEGEDGVREVLRVVGRHEPVAVRRISRATELPVPIVAAICNELRKRGVVGERRPVRLTAPGRAAFAAGGERHGHDASCPACARREVVVPPGLEAAVRRTAVLAASAPPPRVEIDQVHCTVETKLRRVLAMDDAGALDDRRVLLLGDDDLLSLTLVLLARHHGIGRRVRELVVVDVDDRVLRYVERAAGRAPFPLRCIRHDLRAPLPRGLAGMFGTVCTDPPYTSAGALLFLARAADATAGAAGGDVFLSFGPKRPEETLALQRGIADLGFAVQRLIRNFNDYVGAGSLGGTSHLYHLAATPELRPGTDARYDGPLYTGDLRDPARRYRCTSCGAEERTGRGRTVEALRAQGCARCGGTAFAPLSRA
jgi:predicted methyltransferase